MPRFIRKLSRYELISFSTGFVLLAFELVASRLLAPTIGSSTYVWTSVIGVIIAALAIGFIVGGWLADKRTQPLDIVILLLTAASAICLTLLNYQSVLSAISQSMADVRILGVVASISLFLPASFILGMTAPYLVRLRTQSIETAGRSVAAMDAANSLGGISGTFIAGFILFDVIGARQTLLLLVICLVAISWLLIPRVSIVNRLVASCLIIGFAVAGLLSMTDRVLAQIDTPTAHYEVIETEYNQQPIIALTSGPSGLQSGVYASGSKELVFNYTQQLADLIAAKPIKQSILVIGGGTFTLPEHLAQAYPNSQIDAVEIDDKLELIAKQYFNYSAPSNVTIINADGRAYLQSTDKHYDIIVIDAYNDSSVPFSLATAEFSQLLRDRMQPDGAALANFIVAKNPSCQALFDGYRLAYDSAFERARYYPLGDPGLANRQNVIGVFGKTLPWTINTYGSTSFDSPGGSIPTDNRNQIEANALRCSQS